MNRQVKGWVGFSSMLDLCNFRMVSYIIVMLSDILNPLIPLNVFTE